MSSIEDAIDSVIFVNAYGVLDRLLESSPGYALPISDIAPNLSNLSSVRLMWSEIRNDPEYVFISFYDELTAESRVAYQNRNIRPNDTATK